MKWISIATVLVLMLSVECTAQITIKTEYFGTSAYRDEHNQKVGNSKGSAMVYHGSANLPLSMKKNESNQPTIGCLWHESPCRSLCQALAGCC